MRLPREAIIAPEKLKNYLLTPRLINDKCRFLSLAGYDRDNWRRLEQDLRTHILTEEARLEGDDLVWGSVRDPRHVGWTQRNYAGGCYDLDGRACYGQTKFITLFPGRGSAEKEEA